MKNTNWNLSFIVTITLVFSLSGYPKQAKSQQDPVFTQYLTNLLSIQPAYAGITGVLNVSALSRAQWVGWEGAPQHQYIYHRHAPEIA